MSTRRSFPRDLLARTAAASTSVVDVLRRLGEPLGSSSFRYVRDRLAHYGIDTTHFVDEPLPRREPRRYTKEQLEEAAAHSHSIREMLDHMGVPPYSSAYSNLRKKLDAFGIDTGHFTGRKGNTPRPPIPPDDLAPAVAQSHSLAGVLRVLGRPEHSSNRALVQRSAALHGISTAHFVGQAHRRGRPSRARRSAAELLQRCAADAPRTKTALLRRALDEIGVLHVCDECGTGDTWRGKPLVLEIDHINGDRLDNRLENLRYLCPSCHSQTRTFARRVREDLPSHPPGRTH
ncbi:HNH endonuclease signature motif containing protein [Streptomyces sp. NBC_00467]|uniref:HNH endonuclease signature motif containing protein n=1 Tax=Streptomyces sp. NBC_00467 TaxID=2975752 RepID=UPI002E196F27